MVLSKGTACAAMIGCTSSQPSIPSKELLADLLQPRDLCCMSVMVRRIQPRAQPQLNGSPGNCTPTPERTGLHILDWILLLSLKLQFQIRRSQRHMLPHPNLFPPLSI
jgi:hypothetical protein